MAKGVLAQLNRRKNSSRPRTALTGAAASFAREFKATGLDTFTPTVQQAQYL